MNQNNLILVNNKYGKINYFKNDYYIAKEAENNKFFEESTIVQFVGDILKKSKVVLDIGAHAGSHTILYKSINPNLTIYSFEPQKNMFDLLSYNVELNSLKDVYLYNKALGHKNFKTSLSNKSVEPDREFEVSYDLGTPSNLGGIGFGGGGEIVDVDTIDSLNLTSCDYIKIDVEGAENLVLIGGINTISKFKPIIWFESNHKSLSPEDLLSLGVNEPIKTIYDILLDLGYNNFIKINEANYLASVKS